MADPDNDARRLAKELGACSAVSHLEELPDSDGIVVATPSSTHASVIEQVLNRSVPVFVEKPFTTDAPAALRLAAAAPERIFVMDKWRYHAGVEELRGIRERGELGKPIGIQLTHVGWGCPHNDVDVGWILLPHCLSIALEVLGTVPEVRQAFSAEHHGQCVGLSGVLGEDPWVRVEVSACSPVKRREFILHCENGVAWLDDGWAAHIKIARDRSGGGGDAQDVEIRSVSGDLPLLRELGTFVEHLKGGPPPRSSAREAALVVERIVQLRDLARRTSER